MANTVCISVLAVMMCVMLASTEIAASSSAAPVEAPRTSSSKTKTRSPKVTSTPAPAASPKTSAVAQAQTPAISSKPNTIASPPQAQEQAHAPAPSPSNTKKTTSTILPVTSASVDSVSPSLAPAPRSGAMRSGAAVWGLALALVASLFAVMA